MTRKEVREERRRLVNARWRELPDQVRTDRQIAGRGAVACGATWGVMEKCNFACSSCYLTDLGNVAEPLPFAEVAAQLATLRAVLGPGGKVQITSGEVTLLPVEALGRIIAHALSLGLDPMVMTNGERFRRSDGYLGRLVREFGLRKISLHVDTTQRGRRWSPSDPKAPLPPDLPEHELNSLRDSFGELVRSVASGTGASIHVAHTVTVTRRTLEDVSDIAEWFFGQSTFRLLSFLPVAAVGRTEDAQGPELTLDAVWSRVEQAAGRSMNRDAMQFGHRDCNITVPLVLITAGGRSRRLVEVVRRSSRWDARVFERLLERLPLSLDLSRGLFHNALGTIGVALRKPVFGLELGAWMTWRSAGVAASWLRLALSGRWPRARMVLIVVHKFMNAEELTTGKGKERLDACVFKLPHPDGHIVSMCEMNASALRRELNAEAVVRAQPIPTT